MSEETKIGEIAVNISISLFSVLLVFLFLEAAIYTGILGTGNVPWVDTCSGDPDTYNSHPRYGWTWSPDSQYLLKRTENEDWDRYTINSEGFRDTYNKGEKNAVLLGDSHTFGMLADDRSTFSYILDKSEENLSIHNYGMMGYGTAQQLEVYKNVSKRIDHDLVILTYYLGNDAKDNVDKRGFSGERPLYKIENGSLYLDHKPGSLERGTLQKMYFNTPLRHFIFPKYLHHKILNLKNYFRSDISGNSSDNTGNNMMNITEALIDKISELSLDNDAEVLIAVIPEKEEVRCGSYPEACKKSEKYWKGQREAIKEVVERRNNTNILSLLDPLKEKENTYGDLNNHINEKGHYIAAKEIHSWLVKNEIASEGSKIARTEEASSCS